MNVSLDRGKVPENSELEEGPDSYGVSVGGRAHRPADRMKLMSLDEIASDKRKLALVVAVGIAAVLLGTGFLVPGAVRKAIWPFACGFFVAIVLVVVSVVYLVLAVLTAELSATRVTQTSDRIPGLGMSADMGMTPEEVQRVMDTIGQELAQAPAGDIPPYPVWNNGRYKGWIWTLETGKFDKTDTLVNWPPSVPGSCRWWASLQGSTLVLARDRPLPEEMLMPPGGKRQSSGGAPAHDLEDALIVREVDLSGCSVHIVSEGLKGKSRWLRKSPLEIKHPGRDIFEGQREVLLFAAGSAAKEQWFIALCSACKTDGGAGAAISALYSTFCDYTRAAASVEYPQAGNDDAEEHTENDENSKGGQKHPRRWLAHWLHKREHGKQKSPVPAKPPSAKKPAKKEEHQNPKAKEDKPAVLNPTECMDQLWMGKGGTPSPDKRERKVLEAHPGASGKSATEKESRSASAPLPAILAPDMELLDMSQEPEQGPAAAQQAASHPTVSVSPSMPVMRTTEAEEEESSGRTEAGAQPAQVEDDGYLTDDRSCPGSPSTPAHVPFKDMRGRASDRSAAKKGATSQRKEAAAALPSVPVAAGVNLLLARVGFDLLRSSVAKERLQAHIQRKLDLLRIPEYISSLEVVDVDMGCAVPAISNLKALPSPSSSMWPQFLFDIDYPGGLVVIVDAKLELRDSTSWDTLDRAIKRVGGVAAAAVEGHGNGKGAPAATHASDALSPRDSEDDDPTGPGDERGHSRRQGRLQRLRDMAAKGIRNLAEATADHISKMQLRVRVEIHSLQGTVCAWMPPPPNDRLWFGFVTPPELKAKASPILNDDVRGRMLMYSYQITNVPRWVAAKLQSAITKNMTLPSCADIPLPHLLPLDHPSAPHALPAFLASLHQGEGVEAVPDSAEHRGSAQRPRSRGAPKAAGIPQAAVKEEHKQPRTHFHWPRRGSRKPKLAADTAQEETSLAAAASTAPAAKPRRALREDRPLQDMELSTFLTSEEKAEQGEELQTLAVIHGRTQAMPDADASDPLSATVSTSLIVRDFSGSLAVTALTAASGEVASKVAVTREPDDSQHSSFSSRQPATQDLPLPAPAPVAVRPTAAASVGGSSSCAGSSAGSTTGVDEKADGPSVAQPSQARATEQDSPRGSSLQVPAAARSGTESAVGAAAPAAHPAEFVSEESLDGQELLAGSAADAKGGPAAEDEQPLCSSPQGSVSSPYSWSRAGRSASLGGGPRSPQADREGSPGGHRPQWARTATELGGSMSKKYYEAFKNRKLEMHTQGKKLATTLVGQAEQMRKAVWEKSTKDEKRS